MSKFARYIKILSSVTTYFSMPAYNFAWRRDFSFANDFLLQNPFSVIDIGSRDGSCEELETLYQYTNYVGFDADEDSVNADQSNNLRSNWKSKRIFSKFIGTRNGVEVFNLYFRRSESSLLDPSNVYQQNFSPRLRVEKQVEVHSVLLDDFLKPHEITPDLIKLDTQGTEFEVINSSPETFGKSLMIEVEVEFLEMYKNQKLFFDVSKILYDLGFQMLYINRVFGNMDNGIRESRGQLVFGDCLFGLNFEKAAALSGVRKYKYCLLLVNYGLLDFAYQLYSTDEKMQSEFPDFEKVFKKKFSNRIFRRFWIFLVSQLDKVVFFYLVSRKTNHLNFDSDRAWPFR